jgi:hypothetical protein
MQPEKQTKKHEPPLSLHPMSLEEAIKKIAPAKRKKPQSQPPKPKAA